jgi:hypothetical protein
MVIEKLHSIIRGGVKVSFNWTVKSNVPENIPTEFAVVTVSPAGNPVTGHVNGGTNAPPDAINVNDGQAAPVAPFGRLLSVARVSALVRVHWSGCIVRVPLVRVFDPEPDSPDPECSRRWHI